MKKSFLAGAALALLLTACTPAGPQPNVSVEPVASEDQTADIGASVDTVTEPPRVEDDGPQLQGERQTLTSFDSIEIDVLAADIRITAGDEWSISYHISEKEPIKRLGVEGGTLYLETSFDPTEYYDGGEDWFVDVTVPAGTSLSELELESISGNVELRGISCDTAQLSSTSGKVETEDVRARELDLESVSGKIAAGGVSVESLEAETVSGKVEIAGSFEKLKTDTVSGKTEISGSVAERGTVESVSGGVSLSLDHPAAIRAESAGTISFNGGTSKGSVKFGEGVPVSIESISGEIDIRTAE